MGARTPEELETLLEDALFLHDAVALAGLFVPGAVLTVDGGPATRGDGIPEATLAVWGDGSPYVAEPRRVVVARDVALVVTERGANVARRDGDGRWRYAIVRQSGEGIDRSNEKERRPWP